MPTCPFIFTGQRFDAETGLYYYKRRYYDAGLGRFIGRDPIAADVNLYLYCGDSPLGNVDPTGQADCAPVLQKPTVGGLTNVFYTKGPVTFSVGGNVTNKHLTYIAQSAVTGKHNNATYLQSTSKVNVDITCTCKGTPPKCVAGVANLSATSFSRLMPGPPVPNFAWPASPPKPPLSARELASDGTGDAALSQANFPLWAAATTLVVTADNQSPQGLLGSDTVTVVVHSQYWGGRFTQPKPGIPIPPTRRRDEAFTWKCKCKPASPK